MKGIDCTNAITPEIGKQLVAAGIGFVCRYLVPQRMAWKRLTKPEAEAISNAGLQIVSVFESTADRAKQSAPAGILDGREAYEEAIIVSQPKGSTIYFAVDFEATAKDYDSIEAYLKVAASQLPGFQIGVYGSYSVVEEMAKRKACTHFWQTYAWSYGKKSTHANIYQYKNGISIAGIKSADADESYGNEGFWNLKPAATKPITDYLSALKIVTDKFGLSYEYWKSKKDIDNCFDDLIIKIANGMKG